MNRTSLPISPFTTALSGSAREMELRIRSIFQWKRRRPPLPLLILLLAAALLCGNLVSCRTEEPDLAQLLLEAHENYPYDGGRMSSKLLLSQEGEGCTLALALVDGGSHPAGLGNLMLGLWDRREQDWRGPVRQVAGDDGLFSSWTDAEGILNILCTNTSTWTGIEGASTVAHYRFDGSSLEEAAQWDYYSDDGLSDQKAVPVEGGLELYSLNPEWGYPDSIQSGSPMPEQWVYSHFESIGKAGISAHTAAYSVPLTSQRDLTLELRSDRAKRDVFFSPLKEILVYEDGKLLQSIDVPALMASDQPIQAYRWDTHSVDIYPAFSLAEEPQYLYEGLFFREESAFGGQEFGDFNFDGYTDFAIPAVEASPHNVTYAYFLFDPAAEEYIFSFLMFSPPELLKEEELLVEHEHDSQTVQRRYYSFDREGRLVLVRQETELYGQPSDSLSPEPYPGPAEAAEAFRQVMAGDAPFRSVSEDGREYYLSQINELIWNDPAVNAYAEQFAVADLDDDGTPEVIILTNQHIHSEPILVLRWQDGQIYGYNEVGRGMQGLKADGTSGWSDGAFHNGTHRDQYTSSGDGPDRREQLYLSEEILASDGSGEFYLSGQEVTQAEYEAAEAAQDAKPDAVWYNLLPEIIADLFGQ